MRRYPIPDIWTKKILHKAIKLTGFPLPVLVSQLLNLKCYRLPRLLDGLMISSKCQAKGLRKTSFVRSIFVFAILFFTCICDTEETKHCHVFPSGLYGSKRAVESMLVERCEVEIIEDCSIVCFVIKNPRRTTPHLQEQVCSGRVWDGCPGCPDRAPMRRGETPWSTSLVFPGRHWGSLQNEEGTWGAAGLEGGA